MKKEELRAELLGSVDLGLDENNGIILDYYLHPESKAEDAIRSGDVSQVREWAECGLISADNLSDMIKVSADAGRTKITAICLNSVGKWILPMKMMNGHCKDKMLETV